MTELQIRALGHPAKQGSKDFKGMRRGVPILVEADEKLPDWRKAVIAAAQNAIRASGWITLDAPAEIDAWVYIPRPPSVTRPYPDRMSDGDHDKYLRALSDCMTFAKVVVDDSRFIDGTVRKRYADDVRPGARIVVRGIESTLL